MRHRDALRALLSVLISAVLAVSMPSVVFADPTATPSESPSGTIGIRLVDAPVKLKNDPRARTYIIDNLNPGTTIKRRVQVTNRTDRVQTITMYAGPATIVDNAFTPGDPGTKNLLSSWTTVDKPTLKLRPRQSTKVMATIAVPRNAPEMEQYGVVWASTSPQNAQPGAVRLASRVGVRMYISTGPGNGPPSDFTIDGLAGGRDSGKNATVTAHVKNDGGRAVDITGTLNLSDGPGGLAAKPVSATGITIAPGETADVVFVVPDSSSLPNGPWNAKVVLESGVNTHESTQTLSFDGTEQSTSGSRRPAILGTIVIVVVALGALVWWLRRRRRAGAGAD